MSTKEIIKVPGLGDSTGYAYEQCIRVGNLVYVAGQTGVDKNYNVPHDNIEGQARLAFENVRLALEAGGSSLQNMIRMTVFLTHLERDFHEFTAVRRDVLGKHLCASSVIGVSRLAIPSLIVEIEAVGVVAS